jgi:hypothetical protein
MQKLPNMCLDAPILLYDVTRDDTADDPAIRANAQLLRRPPLPYVVPLSKSGRTALFSVVFSDSHMCSSGVLTAGPLVVPAHAAAVSALLLPSPELFAREALVQVVAR